MEDGRQQPSRQVRINEQEHDENQDPADDKKNKKLTKNRPLTASQ